MMMSLSTFLDLQNSSYPTQLHLIIANQLINYIYGITERTRHFQTSQVSNLK